MKLIRPFFALILNLVITVILLNPEIYQYDPGLKQFITYLLITANTLGVLSVLLIFLRLERIAAVLLIVNGIIFIPIGLLLIYAAVYYLNETEKSLISRLDVSHAKKEESFQHAFAARKANSNSSKFMLIGGLLIVLGIFFLAKSNVGYQHIGLGLLIVFNSFMIKQYTQDNRSVYIYENYLEIKPLPVSIRKYILFSEVTKIEFDEKKALTIYYINNITKKSHKKRLPTSAFESHTLELIKLVIEEKRPELSANLEQNESI